MNRLLFVLMATLLFGQLAFAASVPISGLPAATTPTGAEQVPVVQSGTTKRTTITAIRANGVFNVRTMYGAVPNGSTDNSTAIANAFTASNAFTSGIPTVYFDCDTTTTACQYNYSGSGTSPINPTVATTILCAPGVTLNYTGSAHAVDLGPTGLTTGDSARYTVQGCQFTGGSSYTAGIYVNTYLLDVLISRNVFWNFGNQTAYSIVFNANDWTPVVEGNYWRDTDGVTKNMVDTHTGSNVGLLFVNNKSECATSGFSPCSVATTGVGLWLSSGWVLGNEIKYHYPAIRLSSCATAGCSFANGWWVQHNLIEGNTNGTQPAITYGDPSAASLDITGSVAIQDNVFYWPTVSNVSILGPETASSGNFALSGMTFAGNSMGVAPSGVVWVNTGGGGASLAYGNYKAGHVAVNQSTSPALIDTAAANKGLVGVQAFRGCCLGLANTIGVFDSSGVSVQSASYHDMARPLLCADSSGSGTVQSCNTTPRYVAATGAGITAVAGDMILYKTTTTNTGDLTIAVNGGTAMHVHKPTTQGVLSSGDLVAGIYYPLVFGGTYWDMVGR